MTFDLPSERQWEYACRAGSISSWYCGNDLEALEEDIDVVTGSWSAPPAVATYIDIKGSRNRESCSNSEAVSPCVTNPFHTILSAFLRSDETEVANDTICAFCDADLMLLWPGMS